MGRGNVCVTGKYEGLYYVDNDLLHVYRKKDSDFDNPETKLMGELSYEQLTSGEWEFDEVLSDIEWEDTKLNFCEAMKSLYKSFNDCNEWISRSEHAILENNLFYVVVEDNEWSMAVKLIQKEHWCYNLEGLQAKHYQDYLDGIKASLFAMFDEIGTYGGAWTHGTIKRPDAKSS